MKKFLKLIAENQPGAQDEFTVTLTDPVGEIVNQFTITGGDFAFDNFQEFKEEMTGSIEDNEMDQEDMKQIQQNVALADAVTGGINAKAGALSRDGTKMVAKAKNQLYQKMAKRLNKIAKELK
jgi:hypothetical protein|tara:strand:- start:1251 stop:1619 length:369 start_codon:yes stop_codon:yes gene_type:complete